MGEPTPPKFYIKSASTTEDLEHTRELFTAYANSLPIDLTFQSFAAELSSLPGLYSPPTGAIFLAYLNPASDSSDTQSGPIGVIALRPLPHIPPEARICEMKRLYLAPESRGLGIGRKLVEEVIKEATRLGYLEMRLDTLKSMVGARALYNGVGFVEIERYYDNPFEGTKFLSKDLRN
ncbi:N-acetyltransferase [Hyphodiscus hymeniophilus]|uniref:N-acetyltransferase n=1 Tax=Hyphodiscus hymeniophilus TaxID=353542 RepID=A0A9P6VIQ5_9HELO|nr:N-acetyltransferase [Hyphodiscus hymeniophilus]